MSHTHINTIRHICENKPLTFHLWSDLHMEISEFNIENYKPSASILLLGGDIDIPYSDRYCSLLKKVSKLHELIFIIMGNHEYYKSSIQASNLNMHKMCKAIAPNIIFLNNSSYDLWNGYRIIGTTLWSDIEDDQRSDINCFIADYRLIDGWSIPCNNSQYALNIKFLKNEIERAIIDNIRLIVLTHHAPLTSGTSKSIHEGSQLSSAFKSDLSHIMGDPIAIWCFGHTHYCSNQIIKGTHVVSNQRGYVHELNREVDDFDISKIYMPI